MSKRIKIPIPRKRRFTPINSLEFQLFEALLPCVGERGHDEGALETLERIIRERNKAFEALALAAIRK